jgi:hypothetical protein
MTVNEIVYDIYNDYLGGIPSDDADYSRRQVLFKVDGVRAMLVMQDSARHGRFMQGVVQDLGLVEVIKIDRSEDARINSRCQTVRTKEELPDFLDTHLEPVRFVGAADKITSFHYGEQALAKYKSYLKYSSSMPRAWLKENHIYIETSSKPKYINVRGVFSSPLQVWKYMGKNEEEYYNSSYPFPEGRKHQLYKLVMDEMMYSKQIPTDDLNQDSDETKRQNA